MAVQKPLVIINGQVQQIPTGDSIPVTYNGGADPIMSSIAGPVTVATGTYRYYHPTATNITGVYISLGTASSSGSVVIDVKKNGTSIFSGTYPTITATNYLSTLVSITSAITASDYLTIDVTSAGTGASDLNVYIVVDAGLPSLIDSIKYTIDGPLAVVTGTLRWYPEKAITITKVYFSLGVAGTSTSEIDVKKNGTTIFSTKPSATSGTYKSTEQTVSVSVATTDYVTVDVTQTGAAEDAVVTIVYQ